MKTKVQQSNPYGRLMVTTKVVPQVTAVAENPETGSPHASRLEQQVVAILATQPGNYSDFSQPVPDELGVAVQTTTPSKSLLISSDFKLVIRHQRPATPPETPPRTPASSQQPATPPETPRTPVSSQRCSPPSSPTRVQQRNSALPTTPSNPAKRASMIEETVEISVLTDCSIPEIYRVAAPIRQLNFAAVASGADLPAPAEIFETQEAPPLACLKRVKKNLRTFWDGYSATSVAKTELFGRDGLACLEKHQTSLIALRKQTSLAQENLMPSQIASLDAIFTHPTLSKRIREYFSKPEAPQFDPCAWRSHSSLALHRILAWLQQGYEFCHKIAAFQGGNDQPDNLYPGPRTVNSSEMTLEGARSAFAPEHRFRVTMSGQSEAAQQLPDSVSYEIQQPALKVEVNFDLIRPSYPTTAGQAVLGNVLKELSLRLA